MKCLLSANTALTQGTIQLLKSMLDEAGIACVVQNEELCDVKGAVPFTEGFPELWILEDADFAKAEEIKADWEWAMVEPRAPWRCPRCQESNEGQFAACWKCGNEPDVT